MRTPTNNTKYITQTNERRERKREKREREED